MVLGALFEELGVRHYGILHTGEQRGCFFLGVRRKHWPHRIQILHAGGGGPVQLLTDGTEVYARTAGGDFYNLLKTPTQPLLVLGNEGLLKELSASLRPRRRKKKGQSSAGAND